MSPRGGPGRDADPFMTQHGLSIQGLVMALVKAVCLPHVHLINCPFGGSLAEGEAKRNKPLPTAGVNQNEPHTACFRLQVMLLLRETQFPFKIF